MFKESFMMMFLMMIITRMMRGEKRFSSATETEINNNQVNDEDGRR